MSYVHLTLGLGLQKKQKEEDWYLMVSPICRELNATEIVDFTASLGDSPQ